MSDHVLAKTLLRRYVLSVAEREHAEHEHKEALREFGEWLDKNTTSERNDRQLVLEQLATETRCTAAQLTNLQATYGGEPNKMEGADEQG